MKSISLKILKVLIVIDLILLVVAYLLGGKIWAINTQISFLSSTLVMIASIISYKRMVNTRVEEGIITMDDSRDSIDKAEDPYDLYSEDIVHENVSEENSDDEENLADVVKEERKKLKENRRSFSETVRDSKAALSLYRLGAYGALILGFMYLNRHEMLHIPSYLISLSLPPIIIVAILLTKTSK